MAWPFQLSAADRAQLSRIEGLLNRLLQQDKNLMTKIDDLNNAVSTLAGNFVTLDTAIQAEIAAIKNALAADDTTAIETAVANIGKVSSSMAADAASLSDSLAPPAGS